MQDNEKFFPIKWLNCYYEITEAGIVRSVDRNVKTKSGWSLSFKGKTIKPRKTEQGYLFVGLSSPNTKKQKNFKIHRLVATMFIPNPENKPCVNHKDGNRQNNHVDNLEWCTIAENNKHMYDVLGRMGPTGKLSKESVADIYLNGKKSIGKKNGLHGGYRGNFQEMAAKHNCDVDTAYSIYNGKSYKNITKHLHRP